MRRAFSYLRPALAVLIAAAPAAAASVRPAAREDALIRRAAKDPDLGRAQRLLDTALRRGRGTAEGSRAALELARLDYAEGRPADALRTLDGAETWPRPAWMRPQWLYWRAQSRLSLKRWFAADLDFRELALIWPHDPWAESARLGEADCEAAMGRDEEAVELYRGLASDGGAFGAQALWGLGTLRLRQWRLDDARLDFGALKSKYPDSFEAHFAAQPLASLEARYAPASASRAKAGEAPKGPWDVQVGAYSMLPGARRLADHLRRRRYRVQVRRQEVEGRLWYLVQVGPYADRRAAAAAAGALQRREKLPFNLVEE